MNDMSHNFTTETAAEIRANIKAVLPELAGLSEQIDRDGQVPSEILAKLQKAGAFRAFVPKQYGGPGLSLAEASGLIEDVAYADASVAWNMMVTYGSQVITARLPAETLEKFYADGPDMFCKGAAAPKCVATPVEGGYILNGQWPLCSGSREFTWANLGFFVKGEKGLRMDSEVPTRPDFRICIIPAADVEVIKTWDSVGVRGSSSDDMKVTDLFVPEEHTASLFGPSNIEDTFLGMRMPYPTGPHHTAIVMGTLRAAVDYLSKEAQTRKPAFNPKCVMKDEPVFQAKFGEILMRIDSLRALYEKSIATVTRIGLEKREVTALEGGQLGATSTFIHHEGAELMNQIMALSGSGGLYRTNPQQRRWRDLRCAAAHQSANIGHYGNYSRAVLDLAGVQDDS